MFGQHVFAVKTILRLNDIGQKIGGWKNAVQKNILSLKKILIIPPNQFGWHRLAATEKRVATYTMLIDHQFNL